MGVPKRRQSRSRRDKRAAHWMRMKSPALSKCPRCGNYKLPHRVCPVCGTYKDRQVVEIEE